MHSTPSFPTPDDLPNVDPVTARAAIKALRRIALRHAADVSLSPPAFPGAPQHWVVRLTRTRQRMPLEQWVAEWAKTWRKPSSAKKPKGDQGPSGVPDAKDNAAGDDDEEGGRADPREAQANARSIAQIPIEQCPWPRVRAALIYRALAGFDCYAYRPAHQPGWVIWDRQPNPWEEARFTPREWAIKHNFLPPDTTPPTGGDAA